MYHLFRQLDWWFWEFQVDGKIDDSNLAVFQVGIGFHGIFGGKSTKIHSRLEVIFFASLGLGNLSDKKNKGPGISKWHLPFLKLT